MVKLIVTGHGQMASGLLSALHLIAGQSEDVLALDFTDGMTADDVKSGLIERIGESSKVLILCDLLGGTPFKTAASLMQDFSDREINVLSGLNLAMLIDLALGRLTNQDLKELADQGLAAAKGGIVDAKSLFVDLDTDADDGI